MRNVTFGRVKMYTNKVASVTPVKDSYTANHVII